MSSTATLPCPSVNLTQDDLKKIVAYKAVEHVKSGMVVGLGTGSAAKHAVDRIAHLLKQGKLNHASLLSMIYGGDGGEVASAAAAPLEWKFSQVFGERTAGEEVDIISAIEFDKTVIIWPQATVVEGLCYLKGLILKRRLLIGSKRFGFFS